MKNLYKEKRQQGFTIIEVLIVLAIAALILLIVFLAVPALQRNSRNTQRNNDVAALASALSNYASNNNGTLPTADGWFNGTGDASQEIVYCTGATPSGTGTWNTAQSIAATTTNCSTSNNNFEAAKLGYYVPSDKKIWFINTGTVPTTAAVGSESNITPSTNSISIDLGYVCNGTSNPTANSRGYAIYYVGESGSGNGNLKCVGS